MNKHIDAAKQRTESANPITQKVTAVAKQRAKKATPRQQPAAASRCYDPPRCGCNCLACQVGECDECSNASCECGTCIKSGCTARADARNMTPEERTIRAALLVAETQADLANARRA